MIEGTLYPVPAGVPVWAGFLSFKSKVDMGIAAIHKKFKKNLRK